MVTQPFFIHPVFGVIAGNRNRLSLVFAAHFMVNVYGTQILDRAVYIIVQL